MAFQEVEKRSFIQRSGIENLVSITGDSFYLSAPVASRLGGYCQILIDDEKGMIAFRASGKTNPNAYRVNKPAKTVKTGSVSSSVAGQFVRAELGKGNHKFSARWDTDIDGWVIDLADYYQE